jgi:hypothetical protein
MDMYNKNSGRNFFDHQDENEIKYPPTDSEPEVDKKYSQKEIDRKAAEWLFHGFLFGMAFMFVIVSFAVVIF